MTVADGERNVSPFFFLCTIRGSWSGVFSDLGLTVAEKIQYGTIISCMHAFVIYTYT